MKFKKFMLMIFLAQSANQIMAAEGGYSNYIPGFYGDIGLAVAPENGFAFKNDIYFYSADVDKTLLSGEPTVNLDIELLYDYASFYYKPDVTLLGGEYAVAATIAIGGPDINASLSAGGQSISVSDDKTAVGDLTIAPLILYWNDGNFHYSITEYVVIPTADYDVDRIANPGLNYWTWETDFIFSYFDMELGRDFSAVIGYNYNSKNDDTNYQTGQELHFDFTFTQFLSETFAVGLQAFHLQQISKDKGDGATFGSFKARASGIGPAFMWLPESLGGKAAFTAKWLKEVDAKNRLEGDHIFLSFAMSF